MRILSRNLLRTAQLTVSSQNVNFPVDNVFSQRRIRPFRFVGNQDQFITITQSGGVSFDSLIIDGHNLSSTATVTLQGNSTDTWASPDFTENLTIGNVITRLFDTQQSHNFVRILFNDSTLENISIGTIFLANSYTFDISPNWNLQNNVIGRVQYRTFSAGLYTLLASQKEDFDQVIADLNGTIQLSITRQQFGTQYPGYFIIDTDDLTLEPMYAIMNTGVRLTRANSIEERWETSITVEEVF